MAKSGINVGRQRQPGRQEEEEAEEQQEQAEQQQAQLLPGAKSSDVGNACSGDWRGAGEAQGVWPVLHKILSSADSHGWSCRGCKGDNKTKTSIFINRNERNESQKTLRIYINSCGKKGLTESMSWK